MQQIAMINDRILPYEALEPVYLDRAFYFGDGVYEVIRSYNGKIFALDEHLNRFSNSLIAIGINSIDIEDIRTRVKQAYDEALMPNARIYFHITRGSAPRNHSYSDDLKPNFFLTVTELQDSKQVKKSGIAVSTFPDWRWKRCDIKSLNLLANVLAKQDAVSKGCDEAILVDENGFITEGSSSAFFAVFDNRLQTAPLVSNILPSITRKYVIKAAENINMTVTEESLTPEKAKSADELFIAVTTKDIVPVVRFDGNVVKDGKPGRYTEKLMEEFKHFIN
ncbi:MAG: aminotransferase class IV [Sedimentisphaerales bacterium]|nr:aminotransferase class IV [Sedimentisphaerales bacterium]